MEWPGLSDSLLCSMMCLADDQCLWLEAARGRNDHPWHCCTHLELAFLGMQHTTEHAHSWCTPCSLPYSAQTPTWVQPLRWELSSAHLGVCRHRGLWGSAEPHIIHNSWLQPRQSSHQKLDGSAEVGVDLGQNAKLFRFMWLFYSHALSCYIRNHFQM